MQLFFDGDDYHRYEGPWYVFLRHGKFGPGWYQQALIMEAEFISPNPIVRA